MAKNLTPKGIDAIRVPVGKDREYFSDTGPGSARGLVLMATRTGSKSWLWRSRDAAGKQVKKTLKNSEFIVTTTGKTPVSGFTKARRRLDAAILAARQEGSEGVEAKPMPHWVVHDFRTTFNTHGCETLNIPPHVADRILNHVATATRSKIMRVYNKSELFEARRDALVAWAGLVEKHVSGK